MKQLQLRDSITWDHAKIMLEKYLITFKNAHSILSHFKEKIVK